MPGRTEGWGSDHAHQWRTSAWPCPHGSNRALAKGIVSYVVTTQMRRGARRASTENSMPAFQSHLWHTSRITETILGSLRFLVKDKDMTSLILYHEKHILMSA